MLESAGDQVRPDDDALLGRLAGVLARVDPGPPACTAGGLLTWRTVDAELDELLGPGAVAAPRSPG